MGSKPNISKATADKIVKLYGQGKSLREITSTVEVGVTAIYATLERRSVPLRKATSAPTAARAAYNACRRLREEYPERYQQLLLEERGKLGLVRDGAPLRSPRRSTDGRGARSKKR